jgi:hypothetical protein
MNAGKMDGSWAAGQPGETGQGGLTTGWEAKEALALSATTFRLGCHFFEPTMRASERASGRAIE